MKPMLAGKVPRMEDIRLPALGSPKLDGIRALVYRGRLCNRDLEPIRNAELSSRYSHASFEGLDGELILGDATAPGVFQYTSSIVRSKDKDAGLVMYHVFDNWACPGTFRERLATLRDSLEHQMIVVPHTPLASYPALSAYEERCVMLGYEGAMTRDPNGLYKHGRSTPIEQGLLKVKRFEDAEARIIEVVEEAENLNEATTDALGHMKRSTHKANLRGKSQVGKFRCIGTNGAFAGVEFNVGAGRLTKAMRIALWHEREKLPGRELTYRYFPTTGDEKPRFPLFWRWPG